MKTQNEELYEKALDAVMKLFEDVSVSEEDAINNLKALMDEIRLLLASLGY